LKSGVLEYLDAVSVHPYRNASQPPETAAADFEKLRGMIAANAPEGKRGKVPVLSGEWGYSSHRKGVSLETQAAFAVRQQLSNLLHGVPLSIWYDWKNDGPDPGENEHNFGTVLPDLKPKLAYTAIQTLTRELGGYAIERRVTMGNEKDYVLLCKHNSSGAQKLAAWTLAGPHSLSLEINAPADAKFTTVSGTGDPLVVHLEAGRLVLLLNGAPQYVTLGAAVLK
jgi:hypothetical protein